LDQSSIYYAPATCFFARGLANRPSHILQPVLDIYERRVYLRTHTHIRQKLNTFPQYITPRPSIIHVVEVVHITIIIAHIVGVSTLTHYTHYCFTTTQASFIVSCLSVIVCSHSIHTALATVVNGSLKLILIAHLNLFGTHSGES